ncbi:PREDICTED: putative F-box/kelch-repeat protein At4g35120 [Camelina sativa]|uniref:F-box/kelch-repeat protein At4g35120 n=1 Tax=Camelina sativa TaxID=90675 RepID=A0ABM0WBT2_CAMSA|nr:PREDICTED: putative F-box/kelch-repeat protein At4g35120 [Camelina sativa]
MDARVEQPPQKKRKKKNHTTIPPPSFSSLPHDIVLNCLARISRCHYRSLSLVSKSIRSLIYSPELYQSRSLIGNTEPFLYLCQHSHPSDRWFHLDQNLVTDGNFRDERSLSPITPSSSAPSMSTTVVVGYEIYQIGGTINNQLSSAVHVFDCRTHTWRDALNMTVARKRANSAFMDGKIYVTGGTVESSSSMTWAEVFDLSTQTWKPLPNPTNDYACNVVIRRGKLYARSEHNKYVYDSKDGRWKELVNLGLSREYTFGPCCVIEDIMFGVHRDGKVDWYDSERREWSIVKGLEDHRFGYPTIRLANYGGKLIILCYRPSPRYRYVSLERTAKCCRRRRTFRRKTKRRVSNQTKRISCVVIRLEKRIGFSGLQIWGEIERSNDVLTVPNSFKFFSCITL